jgi:hypothetical protein
MRKKSLKRGVMVKIEEFVPLTELSTLPETQSEVEERLVLPPISDEVKKDLKNTSLLDSITLRNSSEGHMHAAIPNLDEEISNSKKAILSSPNDQKDKLEPQKKSKAQIKQPNIKNQVLQAKQLSLPHTILKKVSLTEVESNLLCDQPPSINPHIKVMREVDSILNDYKFCTLSSRNCKVYNVPKRFCELSKPRKLQIPKAISNYQFIAPERVYYKDYPDFRTRNPPCPIEMTELTLWLPIQRKALDTRASYKLIDPIVKKGMTIDHFIKTLQMRELPGIIKVTDM